MTRLESYAAVCAVLILLVLTAWSRVLHYGAEKYKSGHDDAIAAGNLQHDHDMAAARKVESQLRARLATADEDARTKEKAYEVSLEAAQRRMLIGADRLRCPAAPIQSAAQANDRSLTGGSELDSGGPAVMPEASANLLSIGGDIAGLVRRYERVVSRFEECRAVNAR